MPYYDARRQVKRGFSILFGIGCLFLVLSVYAQTPAEESPIPTPSFTPDIAPLATEPPTPLPPTEPPSQTALPTETSSASPAPTEPTTDASVPTQEATAVSSPMMPTATLTLPTETTLTPSPVPTTSAALPLAFSASFDAGYSSALSERTGWVEVTVGTGKALQTNSSPMPIVYKAAVFTDAAVEVRLLLNAGEGQVTQGRYRAGLKADGTVTLYRDQIALVSNTITRPANTWSLLRLETRGTQVQVSVEGALILDYTEVAPVSAGQAGFAASAAAVLRVDDFAVYGVPQTVPVTTPVTQVATLKPNDKLPTAIPTTNSLSLPGSLTAPVPSYVEFAESGYPKFYWASVAGATSYSIEINDVCGDSSVIYSATTTNADSFQMPTSATRLMQGDYSYCLKAVNGALSSAYSPQTPLKIAYNSIPGDGDIHAINTLIPLHYYSFGSAPHQYEFYIDDEPTFTDPHTYKGGPVGYYNGIGLHTASGIVTPGVYYWRVVRLTNGVPDAMYSPVSYKLVIGTAGSTPALNVPSNNAVINAPVLMTWAKSTTPPNVSSIAHYQLHIATTASFLDSVVKVNIDPSAPQQYTFTPPPNSNGKTYYWRVTGVNGDLRLTQSQSRTLVVNIPVPAPPTNLSPANNAVMNPSLGFTWDAAAGSGPYTYEVQISANTSFSPLVAQAAGLTQPQYMPPTLTPGSYKWRVRTVDQNNVTGDWVVLNVSIVQALTAPVSNGISNTHIGWPGFSWTAVLGASNYVIEINDVCGDGTAFYQTTVSSATSTNHSMPFTANRLLQGLYTLCIRAKNTNNHEGPWGTTPLKIAYNFLPYDDSIVSSTSDIMATYYSFPTAGKTITYKIYVDSETSRAAPYVYESAILSGDTSESNKTLVIPKITTPGFYYWWVERLIDGVPEPTVSPVYFTLAVGTSGSAPILTTASGTWINSPITLAWNAPTTLPTMSAITHYRLQIATDPIFSNAVNYLIPASGPLHYVYTPSANIDSSTRYWRVVGLTNNTFVTAVSPYSTFIIDNVAPSTPSALRPLANTTINITRPVIEWNGSSGTSNYTFFLRNVTTQVDIVPQQTLTISRYTLSFNLRNGSYELHVRANDTALNSSGWLIVPFTVQDVLPPDVTGFKPANNIEYNLVQPLRWNAITASEADGGPFTYDIKISLTSTSTPLEQAFGLTQPSYMPTTMVANERYYWAVRAVNQAGVPGAWSSQSTRIDTTPPGMSAASSLKVKDVHTARPDLFWGMGTDLDGYNIEVNDTCADGTPSFAKSITMSTTFYYMSPSDPTLFQGDYLLCVQATDRAENTSPWVSQPFTVVYNYRPWRGDWNSAVPTFSWGTYAGSTGQTVTYKLQISTNKAFTTPLYHESAAIAYGATTVSHQPSITMPRGKYFWRVVRFVNGVADPINTTDSFVLFIGTNVSGPLQISPERDIVINAPVTLRWGSVSPPTNVPITHYRLKIMETSTLTTPIIDVSIPLGSPLQYVFTPPPNVNRVTYYWEVAAVHEGYNVSWSNISTVIVDTMPPGAPVITSPTANSTILIARPTLTWAAVPDAANYQLAVKNAITNVDVITETTLNSSTRSFTPPADLPSGTYIARVRARDVINAGDWSSVTFTIVAEAATSTPLPTATATATMRPFFVPSNVTGISNGLDVTLQWTDSNIDEVRYELEMTDRSVRHLPANTTSYTEANVGCGMTLWYRIRAIREDNISAWSPWVAITTAPCPASCNSSDAIKRINAGTQGAYQAEGKGNVQSFMPGRTFSEDNRYILFNAMQPLTSDAVQELAAEAVPGIWDIYRFDTQTCTTIKASVGNSENETILSVTSSLISHDGNKVYFVTASPNLVAETYMETSVFVRDIAQGTTTRLPMQVGGWLNDITPDGRYLLITVSSNTVLPSSIASDANSAFDVLVYDIIANTYRLITRDPRYPNTALTVPDGGVGENVFEANGKLYVIFTSKSALFATYDNDNGTDTFVYGLTEDKTVTITANNAGAAWQYTNGVDGYTVVGNTLIALVDYINTPSHIFDQSVHQLYTREINLASFATDPYLNTTSTHVSKGAISYDVAISLQGGALSKNGRWVAFDTTNDPLLNDNHKVYVRDVVTNTTALVSAGGPEKADVTVAGMTSSGSHILLYTSAVMVANDNNMTCEQDYINDQPQTPDTGWDYNDPCPDYILVPNPLYVAPPPLPVPGLIAPSNAASFSTPPTFSWEAVAGAVEYHLEFATSPDFTAPGQLRVSTTSYTLNLPFPVGTYYWRVAAASAIMTSNWSAVRSFALVPSAPLLTAPAPAATLTDEQPTFSWEAVTDASAYKIDIDDNAAFTTPQSITVGTTSYTPAPALPFGTYYWRVATVAGSEQSDWSPARSFTIVPPPTPTPSPTATQTTCTVPVIVTFKEFMTNGDARLTIRNTSNVSAYLNGFTIEWSTAKALIPSLKLMRVSIGGRSAEDYASVVNPNGEGLLVWQSPDAMTGGETTAPTTRTPADDGWMATVEIPAGVVTSLYLNFAGTGANSLSDYGVSASAFNGTTFVLGCTSAGGSNVSLPTPTPEPTFTLTPSPEPMLTAPLLTAPAQAVTLTDEQPTFSWSAVAGVSQYKIEIDDAAAFDAPLTATVSTTSYTPSPDLPIGTYYWRVAAQAGSLQSEWSEVFSFTSVRTPPTPTSTPPACVAPVPVTVSFSEFMPNGDVKLTVRNMGAASAYLNGFTIEWGPAKALIPSLKLIWVTMGGRNAHDYPSPTNPAGQGVLVWESPQAMTGGETTFPTTRTIISDGWATTVELPGQLVTSLYLNFVGVGADSLSQRGLSLSAFNGTTFFFGCTSAEPVLTAPLLTAPAQAVTLTDVQPTLTWQAVTNASQYTIEIADNADFNTSFTATVSTTSYTPNPALAAGTYFWRVAAKVGSLQSNWSEVFSFTLVETPQPTPILPADEGLFMATTTSLNVVFTWTYTGEAATFIVQVDDDEAFGSVDKTCTTTALTCTITGLIPGRYVWRVLKNGIARSAVSSFQISPAAPRAVTLVSPLNNRILQPNERPTVTLVWSWGTLAAPLGEPFTYDVEVSTSATFDPLSASAFDLTTPTFTTPALADGAFVWRARAVNVYGVPGAWSAPFRFVVDSVPPASAPVISAPTANVVLSAARPAVTWSAVAGAARYSVEINDVCGDGTPAHQSSAPLTALTYTLPVSAQALTQGTYQACVTAYDASGNGITSAPRPFTIFLGTGPAHGAFIAATTRPTFTWAATAGTTSLTLEYDSEPTFTDATRRAVTGTSHTLAAPLPAGPYYWRVIRSGETVPPSVSRTLYVGALTVGPTLIAPAATVPFNADTALTWQAATPPTGVTLTHYEVVISKINTFATTYERVVVEASALSHLFVAPANHNRITFFWRVRGLSNAQPVTQWSTRSFIVDTVAPTAPVISVPAAYSLVNTVRPTISWAAVPTANQYRLSIVNAITQEVVVPPLSVNTIIYTPAINLPQDPLTVQIEAGDGLNWSGISVRTITVRLGTTPAQNAVVLTNRPIFTWVAVTGAAGYTLEVDNNVDFSSPHIRTNVTGTSYTPTIAEALTSGVYVWRVKPNNGDFPTNLGSRTFVYGASLKPVGLFAASAATPTTADTLFNATEAANLVFNWTPLTIAPLRYQVDISTSAAFPTVGTLSRTSLTPTLSLDGADLTSDGVKYWRVRGVYSDDATGFGPWSDVKAFTLDRTAPLVPLLNPNTPLLNANGRPTFSWATSLGAARYWLTLTDAASGQPVPQINRRQVLSTSYTLPTTLPALNQNTAAGYLWTVQAEDAAGNFSGTPVSRRLLVGSALSPAMDAFVADTTPLFTWAAVSGVGAGAWTLEISTSPTMTPLVYSRAALPASSTSHILPNALTVNTLYYWRVSRSSEDRSPIQGQPFYVVTSTARVTPTLTSPLDGQWLSTRNNAALTWGAPPEMGLVPLGYQVDIAKTNTFTAASLVHTTQVTDTTLSLPALPDGLYYWRVRARFGPHGALGPLSAIRSFRLDSTAPSVPLLSMPVANALLADSTPTFTWSAVTGTPTQYVIEWSRDANFATVFRTATVAVPTLTYTLPPANALPNGVYYWRVRAKDAAGNLSTAPSSRRQTVAMP